MPFLKQRDSKIMSFYRTMFKKEVSPFFLERCYDLNMSPEKSKSTTEEVKDFTLDEAPLIPPTEVTTCSILDPTCTSCE